MKSGAGGDGGPEVDDLRAREDRFWERYEAVVLAEGVEPGGGTVVPATR